MTDPQSADKVVRQFNHIFLWPLQLMPIHEEAQIQKHWELLEQGGADNPWREVQDEFTDDASQFGERHYGEFVSFLPYVQRFLYGGSRQHGRRHSPAESPMRVFRREDIAAVRLTTRPGETPVTLGVKHVDLYFFFDMDVVLLNVEVQGENLPLQQVQELLYRFGRAYPAGWDANGDALHCMHGVEWLADDGRVLVKSDFNHREKYLSFVCQHRAPGIGAHWAYLLRPLVLDHSGEKGLIRYKQIEYYRMPVMAYLSLDDPRALSRAEFIRLGLVTEAGSDDSLPFADQHLTDFESRYCYDRYWGTAPGSPSTRFMCSGPALIVVGDAGSELFTCRERGVLAQFRHQYFMVFLIAHLQKASLIMLSDRLVEALNGLDIQHPERVKQFKRSIRQNFEIFLRFTHRYWFHAVSLQPQTKALFDMCSEHLGNDKLFEEVRQEMQDMNDYLGSDTLRRQANTAIRLTVVTTFGLIGTVATGFLGMNLLAYADASLFIKLLLFLATLVPVGWLTFYTIYKSRRLSDFLEALADENLSARRKFGALKNVWRSRKLPD